MRPEQVPQEWVALFHAAWTGSMGDVRAALAAVAPTIAAAEREAAIAAAAKALFTP